MSTVRDDRRARRLLRLGSDAGPAELRPGFMERLSARLGEEERARAAAADPAAAGDALGALAALAHPALAMALAAALLAGVFLFLSPSGSNDGSGDTLAALFEGDPSYEALVADGGSGWLSAIDPGDNGGGGR